MKAIRYTEYGSPDVLQYTNIETPTPSDDEVLIRVVCAAINPADWRMMRAKPILVRIESGWRRPKIQSIGADVAGVIEAVGKNVTKFKVGDEVFGEVSGSLAEYTTATVNQIVHKPLSVSFEHVAAIPMVGLTALQGLRFGDIEQRQRVLINGASGGIGTVAVEMAKHYGAKVTGVCSGRNIEMVCSLGADHAIDYTKDDFTKTGQTYDLIFDTVGNRSSKDLARALTPNGQAVVAGFTTLSHMFGLMAMSTLRSMFSDKVIGSMGSAQVVAEDLATLGSMIEQGHITPVIDRRYPLAETAEAIRYLETKRARGKVVITVDPKYLS